MTLYLQGLAIMIYLNLYHFTPRVVIFQDDLDIDMLVGEFVYILKKLNNFIIII